MNNIPNLITIFRVLLIPILVIVFLNEPIKNAFITTVIFFIASISDFFDGYLARKYNVESKFGQFLDPIADKLLVTTSLVILAAHYHNTWLTLACAILISREIVMSGIREWAGKGGNNTCIKVSILGKFKTAFQMLAIGGLFWNLNIEMLYLANVFMAIAVILSLSSLFAYTVQLSKGNKAGVS